MLLLIPGFPDFLAGVGFPLLVQCHGFDYKSEVWDTFEIICQKLCDNESEWLDNAWESWDNKSEVWHSQSLFEKSKWRYEAEHLSIF